MHVVEYVLDLFFLQTNRFNQAESRFGFTAMTWRFPERRIKCIAPPEEYHRSQKGKKIDMFQQLYVHYYKIITDDLHMRGHVYNPVF